MSSFFKRLTAELYFFAADPAEANPRAEPGPTPRRVRWQSFPGLSMERPHAKRRAAPPPARGLGRTVQAISSLFSSRRPHRAAEALPEGPAL